MQTQPWNAYQTRTELDVELGAVSGGGGGGVAIAPPQPH